MSMALMGVESKLKWSTHLQMGDDDEEIAQKMRLPDDLITFEILTRLPIKSLIRFKFVSKR